MATFIYRQSALDEMEGPYFIYKGQHFCETIESEYLMQFIHNIDGRKEGRNMFGDCCLIDITIRPGTTDWTNISDNQTTIYGERVPTVKSFTDLIVEKIEEDELIRLNTPKPPSTWVRCRRELGAWLSR